MAKIQRIPSFTTIRLWVLKFGLHKLTCVREQATDWAIVADHTIQIGFVKVFIVLGLRLCNLPINRALTLTDVEPLLVLPMPRSTGQDVEEVLTNLQSDLGSIRLVVADEGSDIKAGMKRFQETHLECDYITDIVHKLARMLHRELRDDTEWKKLLEKASAARTRLLQTKAAHLIPPQRRDKARYLNLEEVIRWARRILIALEGNQLRPDDRELMFREFGWVYELKDHIEELHQLWQVTSSSRDFIRTHGIQADSVELLTERLLDFSLSDRAAQFAGRVIDFVTEQSAKVRPGERLPGSSEIIESLIGLLKYHLGSQSRSGFTSSVLLASALAGQLKKELVLEAMTCTRVKHVQEWAARHLGKTIQAKRREFYRVTSSTSNEGVQENSGTKTGNIITVGVHLKRG